jgi:hypothetical protein
MRHHDISPRPGLCVLGGVKVAQGVHLLEVEADSPFFAVNFDAILVLVAGGEAGSLEVADGARIHFADEERGVIDADFAFLSPPRAGAAGDSPLGAFGGQKAFLDEGFLDRAGDLGEFIAGDEAGHVDHVRAQIAQ